MNFLCHVRVALATDDPRFVLGAVLPDIESLVGPVLSGGPLDEVVADGVALHRRTDAVFHSDPRFRAQTVALSRALQARGVGRGAARGIGHAGWELLLDGLLVADDTVTRAFDGAVEVLARQPAGHGAEALVQHHRRRRIWLGYDDPTEVAARMHRQLARRPLLAFPHDQIDLVAEELSAAALDIGRLGPALIDDVTHAVAGVPS